MIKLKKIVAVALTAAMCLGLSMTAFAALPTDWTKDPLWSPNSLKEKGPGNNNMGFVPATDEDGNIIGWTDPDTGEVFYWYDNGFVDARDANGHKVDVSWRELGRKTLKSIDKEGKVAEIFKKNGFDVPDDTDFIPILDGDINFKYGVPEGGGKITFDLAQLGPDATGLKPGDTTYLMQEVTPGSGVWEIYTATVGPNNDVTFTVPRNGAIVLLKTLSDGTVVALNRSTGEVIDRKPADNVANNNAGTSTSTNPSGAASPKTGEF